MDNSLRGCGSESPPCYGAEVRKEDLADSHPSVTSTLICWVATTSPFQKKVLRGELRPLRYLNDADEELLIT